MHMHPSSLARRRDFLLVIAFAVLTSILYFVPTGFEDRTPHNTVRARAEILDVDNSEIQQYGMIKQGDQGVTLRILDGKFAGQTLEANNPLLGMLDQDKLFQPGDTALTVLTLSPDGEILGVNPQDHYRLTLELILLALFAALLLAFGGWTGLKALLSFVFAGMVLWKIFIPLLLKGWDPIWLALGITAVLCSAIIFLVAGPNRKGLAAFLGAFLGILTSCLLAVYFTKAFHVHGAVMQYAQILLSSGFGHLDLTGVYVAAVFLAASGAVMDLAVDVAASMNEVVEKKPDISRMDALKSGLTVGRAVVGTMTTTLLLAYSGSYITLLMAFMAQGIPVTNLLNLIYVAAEVLKTLVGSFGLVTVAPFTALAGSLLLVRRGKQE